MAIKSKYLNKFYIDQYVINGYKDFEHWAKSSLVNLDDILTEQAIVGYLFTEKDGVAFSEPALTLNLYFISRRFYKGLEISKKQLEEAWELFLFNCEQNENTHKHYLFQNPPIELWLDSKDNWCKKTARSLANQFNKPYYEALSELYLTIMKIYRKNTVYIGNLGYIKTSVYNRLLENIRYDKRHENYDSGKIVSLDTVVYNEGGDDLTLGDMIPADDMTDAEIIYKEILEKAKELLSKEFSPREIDQILTQPKVKYLPLGLYRRLIKWRYNHNVGELYE